MNDGSYQIDYSDNNAKLLNSYLYLGNIDEYKFDSYSNVGTGNAIERLGNNRFIGGGSSQLSQFLTLADEINKVTSANFGYSNASVIKYYTDKLDLNTSWNWISFPRLQRFGNETDQTTSVLSRINIFPVELHIEFKNNINEMKSMDYYYFSGWAGPLNELQSTKGYKLRIDLTDGSTPFIDLYGSIVDPTTEISIFTDQYPGQSAENWTGYSIEYPQEVEDCIPPEVMNDLFLIKTQYWTMFKFGEDTWFTFGRKKPLKYGDMVILKTYADHTFSWISSEIIQEESEIPQTEFFTFEEQADYLPVYIEFDNNSEVQEIAITANGEVKGAAVRESGDTIVEVNAYLNGVPAGTPLEFELLNGYKSAPTDSKDYLVFNRKTKKMEKRILYTGEKGDAQLISLKRTEIDRTPEGIINVLCTPNPFNDKTILTYQLNKPQNIRIDIYNINGSKIRNLVNGKLPIGHYENIWYGDDDSGNEVTEGVYFYKIETIHGVVAGGKIILIKE